MITSKNVGGILEILKDNYYANEKPIVTQIANAKRDPFRILIGTMLSLRTKDEVTKKATERLFSVADTPGKLRDLSLEKIEELIFPVGFYYTKAKNIKKVADILMRKCGGKVPEEMDELLALPGVGRKTANLVLTIGYNKYGICVDTHVHRISNRWGLVQTRTPDETEQALYKKLPQKYWKIYNDYLVSFGQNICKPVSPLCSKCPIDDWCPKIKVTKHR
ncbi:MAG: endonuclease III domain-containing protein [Candidatus Cloacimonadia bacterium]